MSARNWIKHELLYAYSGMSRSGFPETGALILQFLVLALFTVGDVYASLCKKGAYAPFSSKRRSRALFWL